MHQTQSVHIVTRKTSALKSVLWRMIGVVILATITFFFTRHLIVTTKVTLTHHVVFIFIFYTHERLWAKMSRPNPPFRNIIKAIVYELFLGMSIGGIIVYFYTGSLSLASSVTVAYTIVKLVIYVMYDSLWPERCLSFDELPVITT
jgi:uncharacterized membrane protein